MSANQNIDSLSQNLVKIAAGAAHRVSDMLLEAFNGEVAAQEKTSFHDLVTQYDRRSEEMIIDYIFEHHPDSTVLGEEGGSRGQGAVQWYIDPIDGTSNFAAGVPFFCVSIGAALEQQMIAGVIYDPIRGELFSASTQGAFLNDRPLSAQGGHSAESRAVVLTDFPYPRRKILADDAAFFMQMVSTFSSVRRLGSVALHLAYVASGRADVAFSVQANPWDVAAGMLLVEQAGGRYIPLPEWAAPRPAQRWPSGHFLAARPEFDLEQSVLRVFLTRKS